MQPATTPKKNASKALYQAYNHNGTPLMRQPGTKAQAQVELNEYTHQTGNYGGWVAPL